MAAKTGTLGADATTTMTATELARNLSVVLNRVADGESIVITRGGRSIAQLTPVRKTWVNWGELLDILGSAPSPDPDFEDDLLRIRQESREMPDRATPLEWDS